MSLNFSISAAHFMKTIIFKANFLSHPRFFILLFQDLLWLFGIPLINFIWHLKAPISIISKDSKDRQPQLFSMKLNLLNHQFVFICEQVLYLIN